MSPVKKMVQFIMQENSQSPHADAARREVMENLKKYQIHNTIAGSLELLGNHDAASKHWQLASSHHNHAHAIYKEACSMGYEDPYSDNFTAYKKAAKELIHEKVRDILD